MKPLAHLLNAVIVKALQVHDYVQLYFDQGSILNLNNPFVIDDGENGDISDLVGRKVEEVVETSISITIKFSSNQFVEVSLRTEDYRGPEALQLTSSAGDVYIWPESEVT